MLPRPIPSQMGASDTRDKPRPRSVLGYPLTTVIIVLWVLLSWVGYRAFTLDQARSGFYGCEMAYMYPTYDRVTWDGAESERYSVYLYREGTVDPSGLLGLPVVFMPGNAGHFKQVRSIASASSRLFFGDGKGKHDWKRPLDFFALNFNEDFSAFHAPTLEDQARFVVTAVPHILAKYSNMPEANRPKKVMFLGHSMGGIVARLAALQMPNSTVEAIVTMSSPHAIPPLAFEGKMDTLYDRINSVSHGGDHPLLVSICGSISDTQIVSDSCALPDSLVGPDDGFAVFSTDIPGVWTGVEHQAMVWCNQVRWRVARTLLEMADQSSRAGKLKMAQKWLLARPAASPTGPAEWNTVNVDVVASNMTVLVELPANSEATVVDPPVTVDHCVEMRCSQPRWAAHTIPRPSNPDDPFPFPGEGVQPSDSLVVLNVYDLKVRGTLRVALPVGSKVTGGAYEHFNVGSWWSTTSKPAHVSLQFNRPVSSLLAWRVNTVTSACEGPPPVLQHESSPAPGWSESYESRFYPNHNPHVTLHSHISGAPFQPPVQQTTGVKLHIYQQPGCPVERVHISLDLMATIAKAMLRFRIAAVTWCVGWVAILLLHQLAEYNASGNIPSLSTVLETRMRQNIVAVGGILVAAPVLQHLLGGLVPKEQLFFGSAEFSHVPLALMVAFWSLGVVIVSQRALAASITVSSRFWRRPTHDHDRSTHWVATSRLLTAAFFLALVKLFIPWRMAFVVLYIIQYSLVSRCARDEQLSRHNLVSTVLLLMTFLLPLTVPAIAVWGRNLWLNHGHPFASDHGILPLIPVLLVVQLSSDRRLATNKLIIQAVQCAALFLAVVAFAVSPRRAYALLPASNGVFLALSAVLAPLTG